MNSFPEIRLMGVTGVLVRFSDQLSEPANRASLAFRAAIEAKGWAGVSETTTALASTFLRIDPLVADPREIAAQAEALANGQDWTTAPLPSGRKLWRIPCAWGGALGPDLAEAAVMAGKSEAEAIATLSQARTRVLALGFAPGQPYLGELGSDWNIPRRTELQTVPKGAVLLAIRQLIVFTAQSPTGWRHVGQTAFSTYDPNAQTPIAFKPGDEIEFPAVTAEEIQDLARADNGGATAELVP